MSYATITDLRKRVSETKLIQLTDYKNLGHVDTALVTEAITMAEAVIDSYAGGRYSLPLTASGQVKDLAVTIAIYKLHEGRQLAPDHVRQSYEDAISFQRDVAAGKAGMSQSGHAQTSEMDVVTRDHDTSPYRFDDVNLEDF